MIDVNQKLSIIGVPMDLGQTRRGVDMGPSAIRYAGLITRIEKLGYEVDDLGDMEISTSHHNDDMIHNIRNLNAVAYTNERLAAKIDEVMIRKRFPLVIGGDHSISIGSIAGISKYYENLGVIWYDAHGDLNTPDTSPSGNIHGMPLAASLGLGHEKLTTIAGYAPKVKPENIVIIGARSLDAGEKQFIRQHNIKTFTMHDIDRIGMTSVIEKTIDYLKPKTDGIHLSLDLDALDPIDAPGVGTPELGGITYRESNLALELLAESELITSAEIVEVNPILDEKNKTANVAIALLGSLLGEKLL
ncbi:arginase [Longirhabdus pacifica]|uniref:arginase n=1 Tax=Longirhabdus pacifica TaxID=2305227 RepID=UPI0010089974|nr:arginase [Longirhabdus pacifica]